jgi:hypothetical protein
MSTTICTLSPLREINQKPRVSERECEASDKDATDQRPNAQIIELTQKLITSQTISDQPVNVDFRISRLEQQFHI